VSQLNSTILCRVVCSSLPASGFNSRHLHLVTHWLLRVLCVDVLVLWPTEPFEIHYVHAHKFQNAKSDLVFWNLWRWARCLRILRAGIERRSDVSLASETTSRAMRTSCRRRLREIFERRRENTRDQFPFLLKKALHEVRHSRGGRQAITESCRRRLRPNAGIVSI
jgi:hypothetical protein